MIQLALAANLLCAFPFLSHFNIYNWNFNSLLSQYRLCAAGIGLGTAYSLKYKKGLAPMIAAGAVGTTADMVYAYLVECAHLRESQDDDKAVAASVTNSNSSSST